MALERRGPWIIPLATAVVVWRVAAMVRPHPGMPESAALRGALMVLGLWFVAWGLWAYRVAPGRASFLFALLGITSGLHWGGPVALGHADVDRLLVSFYLVASSIAGQALYLHVALAFPPAFRAGRLVGLLYLPAALGAGLFLLGASRGAGVELAGGLELLLLVATLLAATGAILWAVRVVRGPDRRSLAWVGVAVGIDVAMELLSMAGVSRDGWTQLAYGAFPAAVALALRRRCRAS